MSDKRKFKISGIALKKGNDTIKIKDFETPEEDFSDKDEKAIELTNHEVEDDKGTKYHLNIKFTGKKGWYYDKVSGDLTTTKGSTDSAQTYTIDNKGSAVGANWHKGMTFGSLAILAVAVIGAIWYFMFSKNEEEEKEEEGL